MSDKSPPSVAPVSWVIKRDGRQVPFEADKISRSLFAASAEFGRADAFLCRELTDGVLHFMAQEFKAQTPTTSAIAELVVKVVRELGQPALAQHYLAGTAQRVERISLRIRSAGPEKLEWLMRRLMDRQAPTSSNPEQALEDYLAFHHGMSKVYTPDLLAAQDDGLLSLGGARSCRRLAAAVLPHQSDPLDLIESMAAYRRATGDVLILDSPERRLWSNGPQDWENISQWCRALHLGLGDQGCQAIINLHRQTGPGEFAESFLGPLFPSASASRAELELDQNSLGLCDRLLKLQGTNVRIDWHLEEADLAAENQHLLRSLVERAANGQPLCFVFDRPRRRPRLAEGLSVSQNAALLVVGLHLPQLAHQMGAPRSPERFLTKLVSLVRLALSAATQKRNVLRRLKEKEPFLSQGFFLEKARLIVVPVGLDAVVGELTGEPCCSRNAAPLAFGCKILEKIRTGLHEDGQALLLDACIDSPMADDLFKSTPRAPANGTDAENLGGVSVWDEQSPILRQISASGLLHEAARGGTALVRLSSEAAQSVDELVESVRYAWNKTEVLAMRLIPEDSRSELSKPGPS